MKIAVVHTFFDHKVVSRMFTLFLILLTLASSIQLFGIASEIEIAYASDAGDACFTIIALPDTQYYSQANPPSRKDIFTNQTRWVVNQKNSRNIVFVTHLGDIVDYANSTSQWVNANTSMAVLLDNDVPYGFCAGNHDQYPFREPNGGWHGDEYICFDHKVLDDKSYWHSDKFRGKNNIQTFRVGTLDFIIIHVEYHGNSTVLGWVNETLNANRDKRAIITTHSILYTNGTYIGQWEENLIEYIVKPNDNVFLALCGHAANRTNKYVANKTIQDGDQTAWILLQNWQWEPNGGNGWLRILTFNPSNNSIHVESYSPYLDRYNTGTSSDGFPYELWLTYDMSSAYNMSSTFVTTLSSSANLYITDPKNRHIGTDPITGEPVNEIPGASYTGPGAELNEAIIPNPLDGVYDIRIIGTSTVTYTLVVELVTPTKTTTHIYTGNIVPEAILKSKAILSRGEITSATPVSTIGDVNVDGIVDIVDIVACALAFGTKPNDSKWNPLVDLNLDGTINIIDLVIVGTNFGKRLQL